MENKVILERLALLRQCMADRGIDYYMIPTADFHSSEYVNDYFKVREYFCGFTGSNGTLLVWQEGGGLWTDGRYFIQAEKELAGTGVTLFKMLEEGVPTIEEFLEEQMKPGQTLGFDGRVLPMSTGRKYEKLLKEKQITISYQEDLADSLWKERPAFPAGKVWALTEELAGESVASKLGRVREKLAEAGANAMFLSKLDDIMWLFNIRGSDVECNPVAMSYAYVTEKLAVLFVQKKAVEEAAFTALSETGVRMEEYDRAEAFVRGIPADAKILLDKRYVSYTFYKLFGESCTIVEKNNPTELLKAVKNPVELAHMEEIYLKDSVAVTKFIYWLKQNIGKTEITEVTAAEYLDGLRRQIPEFLDLSFPTIAGYKENAAMMHYEATAENHAVLKAEGMLLVDSGGQYMGGTTDVTRTIVLGPISEEIKRHYTAVAEGMLQMTAAKWLYGCTGRNLDILARKPLWDMGLDYKCGTGHGVGYLLNVHEGPQSLRWRYVEGAGEAVLTHGMDVTNEPGVYVEGSHGIRIENVLVVRNGEKNEYGQFMHFDTLTWVPLDPEGIEEGLFREDTKKLYRVYQSMVYEKISPYLTAEEADWLRLETGANEQM